MAKGREEHQARVATPPQSQSDRRLKPTGFNNQFPTNRRHSLFLSLFPLIAFTLLSGCSDKSSPDYKAMESMADKLKVEITQRLDNDNFSGTENLAIASSFFAREMECVSGRKPRLDRVLEVDDNGEVALINFDDYRAKVRPRIEATILNPKQQLGNLSEKSYQTILSRVLSKDELNQLAAIRERRAYWAELQNAFTRQ